MHVVIRDKQVQKAVRKDNKKNGGSLTRTVEKALLIHYTGGLNWVPRLLGTIPKKKPAPDSWFT